MPVKSGLGKPYLYRSLVPPWVLNFPTKDHSAISIVPPGHRGRPRLFAGSLPGMGHHRALRSRPLVAVMDN